MQQQTNKIKKRIIAIMLIFVMTFGNFGLVGRWSYAAGLDFLKGSEYQFNAFFAGNKDAKDLSIKQDVNEPAIMNLEIGISGDGYIKDGTLEILGRDGSKALSYTAEAVFGDYEKIKETSNTTNTVVNNTVTNTITNTATNTIVNNTVDNTATNTIVNNTVDNTATNTIVNNTVDNTTTNTIVNNTVTNTIINNTVDNTTTNTIVNNTVDNTISNTVVNNTVSNTTENIVSNTITNTTNTVNNTTNTIATPNNISVGTNLEPEYVTKTFVENKVMLDQINTNTKMYLKLKYISSNYVYASSGDILKFKGVYVDKDLKEHIIEKTIDFSINWISKQDVQVSSELVKYIPYNIGEKSGVILQEKIVVNKEGNILVPTRQTIIETNIPTIAGILPISVDVVPLNINGTTGKDISKISDTDVIWNYQNNTQTLKIETNNDLSTNKAWAGKGYDEYLVIYQYDMKIDEIREENRVIENKIKVQNKLCNGEETNKELNNKVKLEGQIGDIVSWNTVSTNNIVNKAKMLANYNTENVYETEMQSKIEINISSSELVNQIALKNGDTNFITNNGEVIPTGSTYYKSMIIKRDNLLSLIGEQGSLNILSEAGEVLCTINAQTPVDANNEYVINFMEQIRNVIIQTSKITGTGILDIAVTRGIKTNEYDKAVIKNLNSIEENIEIFAKYADRENLEKIGDSKIVAQLENAKTQATLELSQNEISTYNKVENVEMRIELNNNKETSDMYENGTFLIVFPKTIQEVNVNNAGILYGDEFAYTSAEQIVVDGQIAIKLEIEGKQNGFNTINLSNGTNLVLNMDIKANVYAPNKTEKVELFYINSDVNEYAVQTEMNDGIVGYDSKYIKIVSGNGLVNITTVSELQDAKEEIAIRGEKKTLELDAYKEEKSAEMKITLVNNEKEAVRDVQVLGRIPFENNKSILTNESLGSTFTANMTDGIRLDGLNNAKVYYSEKEDATADLANGENEWTMQVEDYSKVKSYLIDLKDEIINPEDVVDIKYNVEIPANLQYDEESIATHKLFYTLKGSAREETYTSIALATPEGPNLEVTMDVDVGDGATVHEYEMLKYTITVKNTGNETINNVVVTAPIPEGTFEVEYINGYSIINMSTEEKVYNYEKLEANQEIKIDLFVRANKIYDVDTKDIIGNATVTSDEFNITSNNITNHIKKAELKVELHKSEEPDVIKQVGDKVEFAINVSNAIDRNIENIYAEVLVPQELTINNVKLYNTEYIDIDKGKMDFNESTRILRCAIGNLDPMQEIELIFDATISKKVENGKIFAKSAIKGENTDEYKTNELDWNVAKPNLSVEIYIDNTTVVAGEEFEYYIQVTNNGEGEVNELNITHIIPNIFNVLEIIEYFSENNTTSEINAYKEEYPFSLPANSNAVFKVKLYTDTSLENGSQGEVYATISKEGWENIETDKLAITVKSDNIVPTERPSNTETPNPTNTPENTPTPISTDIPDNKPTPTPTDVVKPTTEPTDKPVVTVNPTPTVNSTNMPTQTSNNSNNNTSKATYKIIGTAWLDENKDGIKDNNEKDISGITVGLINAETNSFEKNNNGNYIKATTKSDGTYSLEGIASGRYIVVFEYDNENYSVTKYKVSGVAENKNSNVATNKIQVNGEESIVAVSDVIQITNENIGDINIGLIRNSILDFKIEKTVKKITVTTHKGTETKNYNNVTLAKTEIHAKEMNGAKVRIDYEIKVSNVGEVAGTIGEVIDYIPAGTQLVQGSGWTSRGSNQVVNTSLQNKLFSSGESTILNISVEKTMTNDNTGVVENKAELNNINSLASNETIIVNDTNVAKANVIITVKTGIQPMYIIISVIVSLMIIGIGIKIYRGKNN